MLWGSPIKIAALTAARAVPVRVAPAPPQRALSKIWPPYFKLLVTKSHRTGDSCSYLRIADDNQLSVGALRVEGGNGLDYGRSTLGRRALVAGATAVALATASRVNDRLGGSARISLNDHVDETLRSTIALGDGGLTGTEDVNLGAALALLDLSRAGASQSGEDGKENRGVLHVGDLL